jgi:7,8-dihydropterin-6-yl-methyl-4-(beta-D-ribofuranosyl)aminobenzene 5'-phosphate synthase
VIKKSMAMVLLGLIFPLAYGQVRIANPSLSPQGTSGTVVITVLFDNAAYEKSFKPGWGFACFIQGLEKTLLFDTGANADIFQHNMKQARIDPEKIQYLVISHGHGDHTGGLESVAGGKGLQALYLPEELPSTLAGRLD